MNSIRYVSFLLCFSIIIPAHAARRSWCTNWISQITKPNQGEHKSALSEIEYLSIIGLITESSPMRAGLMRQKSIESGLDVARSYFYQIIDSLEERGIIERESNGADKYQVRYSLTSRGQSIANDIAGFYETLPLASSGIAQRLVSRLYKRRKGLVGEDIVNKFQENDRHALGVVLETLSQKKIIDTRIEGHRIFVFLTDQGRYIWDLWIARISTSGLKN